ncbi:glycerol-3-phosphate dehydrogenase/oxidase [Mesorhizobium sp. VK23B]|uniref:Glycerol-3-phosphate dehydrogenase/oxidase n=1 Tax=Mesorhizobium dulcispinae TaxID=3072316 RepID=A0ABU4X8B0_9HYPH|nr:MULTISPECIES: glycerol-3-phosphate dehydrogenase/oxidase [unclassified Mesorhizobium]MDX8464645.1 glycerol-3-phosphate dehydrogenase/oxidase [Mesorhizobium sp. VK23B]MDX8471031.1 glycerol-3-phosphate dehydrogenase/oxidase [Mesorhizobium sp. VK23A]
MPVDEIDVLILGAGINGAGLFRDLCEQGLKAVIIEKGDFGSGTSAAPSRLIHGGLKYLETGELGLVAQSTLERNLLLRNAPHLVRPLPTVIPIFSWLKGIGAALRTLAGSKSAPRSRGALLIKLGLAMYDFYGARHRVMPRHALWSKARALRAIPPLTPRIVAAGTYFDATVRHPERLVLELLRDGIAAQEGAEALNYASIAGTDGRTIHIALPGGGQRRFQPRVVVNAAGPWIDGVNAQLGAPSRLIGGTKGSHILLDHPELIRALDGRMIYFEADDGRICLVFDYLARALVGSTDIRASDPETVRCENEEVDYLLQSLQALLPGLSFDRSQIVYAYSGIRPLPNSEGVAPGLISRDHSAPVAEPADNRVWPIVSLVGGKWTTFRGFAEEVADMLLKRLGASRRASTRDLAIGGGHGFPTDAASRKRWLDETVRRTGAMRERAELLLDRYGTTAEAILACEGAGPPTWIPDAPGYTTSEVEWLTRTEQVVHLGDVVMRRTTLAITGSLSRNGLEAVADVVAGVLGWSAERRLIEIKTTLRTLVSRYRLRLLE